MNQGLESLAAEFELPYRQLTEAREVLLRYGQPEEECEKEIARLCSGARDHGGGLENFNKMLLGYISILKAQNSTR